MFGKVKPAQNRLVEVRVVFCMKARLRGVPPPENMQFEMRVCKLLKHNQIFVRSTCWLILASFRQVSPANVSKFALEPQNAQCVQLEALLKRGKRCSSQQQRRVFPACARNGRSKSAVSCSSILGIIFLFGSVFLRARYVRAQMRIHINI